MLPRTYVYCSGPPAGPFDQFAARLRAAPGWRHRELATGHDAMITAPEAVADVLREAGEEDGPRAG